MMDADTRALDLADLIRERVPGARLTVQASRQDRGASLMVRLPDKVTVSVISDGYGKHSDLWEAWDFDPNVDPAGWQTDEDVVRYILDRLPALTD